MGLGCGLASLPPRKIWRAPPGDESSSDLDEEEHSVRTVSAKILTVKVEDDVTDNDGVETIPSPSHDDLIEPVRNRRNSVSSFPKMTITYHVEVIITTLYNVK